MTKLNTACNLSCTNWRKSSRSQGAGACVEISTLRETIGVRDSRNPHKVTLTFTASQWQNFIQQRTRNISKPPVKFVAKLSFGSRTHLSPF